MARDVVLADMVFTASAVILQPVTGLALVLIEGYSLSAHWLVLSMVLYVLIPGYPSSGCKDSRFAIDADNHDMTVTRGCITSTIAAGLRWVAGIHWGDG